MIDLASIRNNIKYRCLLPPEKTAELCDEIERLSSEVSVRNEALETCRVKLEKLFDATDGIYHGGMEHSQLIRWIKELVSEGLAPKENQNDNRT